MKHKKSIVQRTVSGLTELLRRWEDKVTPNPFQLVRVIPKTEEDFGLCKHLYPNGEKMGAYWWKIEPCDYYCPAPVSNPIADSKLRRDLIKLFNERNRIKSAFGNSAYVQETEHFKCDRPERERVFFRRPYTDSIVIGEHLPIYNYHKNQDGSFGGNCPIELRYIVSSDPEEILQLKADGIDKMVGEESRCYWYLINYDENNLLFQKNKQKISLTESLKNLSSL